MELEIEKITVEEAESLSNSNVTVYELTVRGWIPVSKVTIHGDNAKWVFIHYASGGSSAGTPAHWATWGKVKDNSNG